MIPIVLLELIFNYKKLFETFETLRSEFVRKIAHFILIDRKISLFLRNKTGRAFVVTHIFPFPVFGLNSEYVRFGHVTNVIAPKPEDQLATFPTDRLSSSHIPDQISQTLFLLLPC